MKIHLTIIFILISFLTFSQTLIDKLGHEACECYNSLETKTDIEKSLDDFNVNCWADLLNQHLDEMMTLMKDTSKNGQLNPDCIEGYQSGTKLASNVMSNLIRTCDGFYGAFRKMIPNKITPQSTPIYGEGEIDSLTKYIDLNVNLYSNYCDRATAYYLSGNIEKALSDFKNAIETQPNEPTPHVYRGIINRNIENYCEAQREFEKAYELSNSPFLLLFTSIVSRECKEN